MSTPIVIMVVAAVLVALVLLWMARARRKASASLDWPTVKGRVLESHYEAMSNSSQIGYATMYYPMVKYEYSVDGQPHQGAQVIPGPKVFPSGSDKPQEVEKYPAGSPVAVYYNPGKPAESALEPEPPGVTSTLMAGALIVVILVVAFALIFMTSVSG